MPFAYHLQDFLGDDFKSQGSHVPYNVAEFSTQVFLVYSTPCSICGWLPLGI